MAIYGLLGDIHGNREALEAVLAELDAIGVHRVVCVGDLVGYNADPDDCVEMLRSRRAVCIAGNHDLIGTGRLGFERCSNKAKHSLKRTRTALSGETSAFLHALPANLRLERDVLLIHGGVRDVQQYMTHPKHVLENIGYLREDFPGTRVCFFGHTHEQRVFEVDGASVAEPFAMALAGEGERIVKLRSDREYFVNPGSVDASRKRAVKLAEFAVFDSGARTLDFRRVRYDEQSTEARAEANGYRIEPWRDRLYEVQRRLARVGAFLH